MSSAIFRRSAAAVRLLEAAGGSWRLCAWALRMIPPFLRDSGYDFLARVRRHLARKPMELCPVVTGRLAERFRLERFE